MMGLRKARGENETFPHQQLKIWCRTWARIPWTTAAEPPRKDCDSCTTMTWRWKSTQLSVIMPPMPMCPSARSMNVPLDRNMDIRYKVMSKGHIGVIPLLGPTNPLELGRSGTTVVILVTRLPELANGAEISVAPPRGPTVASFREITGVAKPSAEPVVLLSVILALFLAAPVGTGGGPSTPFFVARLHLPCTLHADAVIRIIGDIAARHEVLDAMRVLVLPSATPSPAAVVDTLQLDPKLALSITCMVARTHRTTAPM